MMPLRRLLGALTLAVLVGAPLSQALSAPLSFEQRSRLDPLLRDAAARPEDTGALASRMGVKISAAAEPELEALIRARPGVTAAELRALAPSIQLGSQAGRIFSARLPLSELAALAAAGGAVEHISASRQARLLNDIARSSITSGGLWLGTAGPSGANGFLGVQGRGVVVGVLDTGIDFRHPDFLSGASSRIKYMWDQTTNGTPPRGYPRFNYGVEYLQTQLNAELTSSACRSNISGCSGIPERDVLGHGSHVAGSAAGGDAVYGGMAPQADLIIVKCFNDSGGGCTDAHILDGVDYIFKQAAALGEPAVVNLSLGEAQNAHDGTTLLELGLDALTGPGRIITAAAGNDGGSGIHGSLFITGAGSSSLALSTSAAQNQTGQATEATIDFWTDAGDAYAVSVSVNGGAAFTAAGGSAQTGSSGGVSVRIDNASGGPSPNNGLNEVYIDVNRGGAANAVVTLSVTFRRTATGGGGRVDGWTDSYTVFNAPDNTVLVEAPGAATGTLTVGAYVTRNTWTDQSGAGRGYSSPGALGGIAAFSSPGPTRDNRTKPDLSAPGMGIVSTLSQSDTTENPTFIVLDKQHFVDQGTSMASPQVAGLLALRLQEAPSLTPAQARAALAASGRIDAMTGALPNNTWGGGKALSTPPAWPAPSSFSGQALSTTRLNWNWAQTALNGSSVQVLRAGDGLSLSGALAGSATTFLQTGLSTNTFVSALAEVLNEAGASTSSAAGVYTLAAAPAALSTTAVFASSASFAWSANGNPPGTAYELDLSSDNFTDSVSTIAFAAGWTAAAATVTGLSPAQTYWLRVRAQNGGGVATAFSNTVVISGPPAPPAGLAHTALGTNSAALAWSANGNPPGTVYELSVSKDGFALDFSTPVAFGGGLTAPATTVFLTPNTTYYARVRAQSASAVAGAFSNVDVFLTGAAATPAPGGLSLVSAGSNTASVAWTAPPGASPSTIYQLSLSADGFVLNFSTPAAFSASLKTASLVLTGLAPLSTYYVRVQAETPPLAPSAYSGALSFFTVATSSALAVPPAQDVTLVFQNVKLTLPAGSFGPGQSVSFTLPPSFPAPNSAAGALQGSGFGVQITPSPTAQPAKALTLSISVDTAAVAAAGLQLPTLVIARYDPAAGNWTALSSAVDAAGTVTAQTSHLSTFQVMSAAPAASAASPPIAYPNPVRTSRGETMTFMGLPLGAELRIYTAAGLLVRNLAYSGSSASWDGRNDAGSPAASGVYFVLVRDPSTGDHSVMKVIVER